MTSSSHSGVPQRTCVGCRQIDDQGAMVRVTRDGESLLVHRTTRLQGRGAYLHAQSTCLTKAQKGGLSRSFRTAIPKNSFAALREQILEMISEGSDE